MFTKNFINIIVCSFLFAHVHLHTAEQDIENPAIIQLNNQETVADRQARLDSARHAFIGSGINFFTGAFQLYTLSACNQLCNASSRFAFWNSLLAGSILTGGIGGATECVAFVDWCVGQQTPSYPRSTLKTLSLSALSLSASFYCGLLGLSNPNHFSVINGSGVATAFATGAYLLYKGFKQSRERQSNTNLIEDLLEPEDQI